MIDLQTWLPQIVGYCEFIADAVGTRRAWIQQNFELTSATGFDELYEQIFDDLDSDNFEKELVSVLPDIALRKAISQFLEALRSVNFCHETDVKFESPKFLFQSNEWQGVVRTAVNVLHLDEKDARLS